MQDVIYEVGHKVLAASFGFIFDISSLLSSVLKEFSGFGGNAVYLIKSFFQMFQTKRDILSLTHGTRTENSTNGEHPWNTLNPPRLQQACKYTEVSASICFHCNSLVLLEKIYCSIISMWGCDIFTHQILLCWMWKLRWKVFSSQLRSFIKKNSVKRHLLIFICMYYGY